jgi:hypothetical protein
MEPQEELTALENQFKKLKFEYEQYFQGESKIPPEKLQTELENNIRRITTIGVKNIGVKFRLSTIVAKYQSHKALWSRNMRLFEEGKIGRGKIKLAEMAAEEAASKKKPAAAQAAPKQSPAQAQAQAAPAAPAPKPAMAEDPFASTFREYVDAKKRCNEDVTGMTQEKLAETLKKQTAQIKEKYKAKDVKFKVVIEDGKTKLKAVPIT